MPHDRYFSEDDLTLGKKISLSGGEWHHLVHVMRKKEKECVEIVNGKGKLAKAVICSQSHKEVFLEIVNIQEQTTPTPPLYLAQSWIASAKIDWILEKGCEMGVSEFFFFSAEGSPPSPASEAKQTRMRTILISAMKQCGRLDLPKISIYQNLSAFAARKATFLFGDMREKAPFLQHYLDTHPLQHPPCFLVGPEKGFTAAEIQFLEEKLFSSGVRLHANILRSETAALMALSLLAHLLSQPCTPVPF